MPHVMYPATIPAKIIVAFGVDPWCWGLQREESYRLFSREIIFEVFQPMWPRYLNVTGRQTGGQFAVLYCALRIIAPFLR